VRSGLRCAAKHDHVVELNSNDDGLRVQGSAGMIQYCAAPMLAVLGSPTRRRERPSNRVQLFTPWRKIRHRSAELTPRSRHWSTSRQTIFVTIFPKPKTGRCVTLLLPATYRRCPDLDPVWHSACGDDVQRREKKKDKNSFSESCFLPLHDDTSEVHFPRPLCFLLRCV
jgi:hypothetical protein